MQIKTIYSMPLCEKICIKYFTLGYRCDRITLVNGSFNFDTEMSARPYILYVYKGNVIYIYSNVNLPHLSAAYFFK